MAKPTATPKDLICSECELDWDLHPENPRRRDCIELLKARPPVTYTYPYNYQYWWGTNNNMTRTLPVTETTTDTIVINTN